MVILNRRKFLKIVGSLGACAALGIIPKTPTLSYPDKVEPIKVFGTLTSEMLENAAKQALENFGKPDVIMMSPATMKNFLTVTKSDFNKLKKKFPEIHEAVISL